MPDIKKAPYQLAYENRIKQIGDSMKSEHHGPEPTRDLDFEKSFAPNKDSHQLGEGSTL